MSNYGAVASPKYPTTRGIVSASKRNVARLEKQLMKKSLKQKFKEWLFKDDGAEGINMYVAEDEDSVQLSRDRSIRFEIHSANGGRVVQTRRYDSQKDRHIESLYIITSEMDFGREIDKIITMEALR